MQSCAEKHPHTVLYDKASFPTEYVMEVGLHCINSVVLSKQTEMMPAGFSLCTAWRTLDEAYYQIKPYWDLQYHEKKNYNTEGNLEFDFPWTGNLVSNK